MEHFSIPVVMIIFKRTEATMRILERVSQVKPNKLYLLGDEGRNDEEKILVAECRMAVEVGIDWDCEVVKNYATENRGVYANIGLGAKWIFEREPRAIFLEDDNLPEITFFRFCQELLDKYEEDTRVLWICGTNYLGKYKTEMHESYMFTKHLLPCGWASWSGKFLKNYDGELLLAEDKRLVERVKHEYENQALYRQQIWNVKEELKRKHNGIGFQSWDYQMAFSIRANSLYGISPCNNQIKNIGVDSFSEHGGNSFDKTMTERFCGMESYPLEFPLTHPKDVLVNKDYEKKIEKIILWPFLLWQKQRVLGILRKAFRKVFRVPEQTTTKEYLKNIWRTK